MARRYGGAGLGLVFVKRIAEAMGGGLTVTSSPRRGVTFRMSVVVQDVASAATSPRARLDLLGCESLQAACASRTILYGRVVLDTLLPSSAIA